MNRKHAFAGSCFFLLLLLLNCKEKPPGTEGKTAIESAPEKLSLIFDTDANNELDDQHALAYLLFNSHVFEVPAVTVNATYNGGDIQGHYEEADRVLKLSAAHEVVPLLKGANAGFEEILASWDPEDFDGQEAVDFILQNTRKDSSIIVAVGKLTNVALALKKDPGLAGRTRVVWLGSNYPDPGEYNQDNDTVAMNYILNSNLPFEMVTVRYGKPSGSDAVRVTPEDINRIMPGLGPVFPAGITGRHGGTFHHFGDYSVDLFEHIDLHGDPPSRALFDMVALAVLKNPDWGERDTIPAPLLVEGQWKDRPDNSRKIILWENFNKDAILKDFYNSMQHPRQVNAP